MTSRAHFTAVRLSVPSLICWLAVSCVGFRCGPPRRTPSFPGGPCLGPGDAPVACGRLGFLHGSAGPVALAPGCHLRAPCSSWSGSRRPWRLGGAGLGWGRAGDPSPLHSCVPLPCLELEQGGRVAGLGSTWVPLVVRGGEARDAARQPPRQRAARVPAVRGRWPECRQPGPRAALPWTAAVAP